MDGWVTKAILTLVVGFVGGLVGVAAGYGMLKQQVKNSAEEIYQIKKRLSTIDGTNPEAHGLAIFMRRGECEERQEETTSEISDIKKRLDGQHRSLRGIQNYIRWVLTAKEKLGPSEINRIINGDE